MFVSSRAVTFDLELFETLPLNCKHTHTPPQQQQQQQQTELTPTVMNAYRIHTTG